MGIKKGAMTAQQRVARTPPAVLVKKSVVALEVQAAAKCRDE